MYTDGGIPLQLVEIAKDAMLDGDVKSEDQGNSVLSGGEGCGWEQTSRKWRKFPPAPSFPPPMRLHLPFFLSPCLPLPITQQPLSPNFIPPSPTGSTCPLSFSLGSMYCLPTPICPSLFILTLSPLHSVLTLTELLTISLPSLMCSTYWVLPAIFLFVPVESSFEQLKKAHYVNPYILIEHTAYYSSYRNKVINCFHFMKCE